MALLKRIQCIDYDDKTHKHTFVFFSSLDHNVSVQFLQLSMQVFQPAVGGAQLAVHLSNRGHKKMFRSQKHNKGRYEAYCDEQSERTLSLYQKMKFIVDFYCFCHAAIPEFIPLLFQEYRGQSSKGFRTLNR